MEIRRLHPTVDLPLFEQSFEWLVTSPKWRRHVEAVFGTLNREEYLLTRWAETRIDIGVFDGPDYIAKVALHITAKHTYEVSLEARRDANPAVIIDAGCAIRDQLFGLYGAQLAYAWVPRWAKSIQAILTAIGFQDLGISMLRGVCRGRLIEWEQFSIRSSM